MKERLSSASKNAANKKWYREHADRLDSLRNSSITDGYGVSIKKKMKVNYDLFNNILNLKDFEYVCKPFGDGGGELPATMVNRDITSGKIKALLGMEQKRPFSFKVVAVNPEATSRKEQEEFGRMRDYVISQVMGPIQEQSKIKEMEALEGQELDEDQIAEIKAQIAQDLEAATPEEVKMYMKREHQDPAEVQAVQLLTYLEKEKDLARKFNKSFKHGMLSSIQCMYVGEFNGEPDAWVVNSMSIDYDKSPDLDFIEEGEYASCLYPMNPSNIVNQFGSELTDKEIDRIYEYWGANAFGGLDGDLFAEVDAEGRNSRSIDVLHTTWKSLRKLGFLTYIDEEGEEQEKIVDELYVFDEEFGDVDIEWNWVPESYETWKILIGDPIYLRSRPIPGQFKDINNIRQCKLPYHGIAHDNMNSTSTSLMDRLKVYQYYYNIVMYRLELLIASDKGKKVLMNIGAIPTGSGIDIKQWQYFFESSPFMWYDPQEEGNTYNDVNTVAKVVDLSLASDIQKYIEIAEYLRRQSGNSVGITEQVEGQIGPREAVRNTQQSLQQSSHILEPYFYAHNIFKRNVITSLLEKAKVCYAEKPNQKLSYVMDDMSLEMFDLDTDLLDNSTYGIYVSDSGKIQEIKEKMEQLTHAAMQNQKAELSDLIAIMKEDDIVVAEEKLKVAEDRRREFEQKSSQDQIQAQQQAAQEERAFKEQEHEWEKELIILKEEQKRITVVQQAAITGMSFNPDIDTDGDGVNDFLEIAKAGVDADIRKGELELEKNKFNHQKEVDKNKDKNEKEKLKNERQKISASK